jgi:hypothetical protein
MVSGVVIGALSLVILLLTPIPFVVTSVPGAFVDYWPIVTEQNVDSRLSVQEAETRFATPPNFGVKGECFPRCSWFGLRGRAKARYWQKLGVVEVISRSRPKYRNFVWDFDRGVERVYGTQALRYVCGSKKNDRCLRGAMELRQGGVLYRVEIYGLRRPDFCSVVKFYAEKRRTAFDQRECAQIVSRRN